MSNGITKAKMTSKGQVTIPKDIRERLGLRTGDEIAFVPNNGGVQLQKILREDPFEKWRGYLKDMKGQDVDDLIEEMRGR